jgi:hypothetical protein
METLQENNSGAITATIWPTLAITTIFPIGRIIGKTSTGKRLWWDDYILILA